MTTGDGGCVPARPPAPPCGAAELSRREFLARSSQATAFAAAAVGVPALGGEGAGARGDAARIRIGQIGTGHGHAAGKMRTFRASPAFEVVGVVEPDRTLRERAQASSTYRDVPFLTREQLFSVSGLRAVAVETRVADLLASARAAIDAGFHVHLDKPAGASLPAFRELLAAARRKGLAVQLGYMYRYNPGIVFLRDLLRGGVLGEPFEAHAVMSKVVAPADRRELAAFGGGMMFELGCHLIDLLVDLLGAPQRVTPFLQHAARAERPAADGLMDNTLAVFEYPRALATVKSSALEVEGFARRHLVICGSEGTCHVEPLDAPNVRVALAREARGLRRGYQTVELGDYDRYVADADDLARIIRGEKAADFTYEHDEAVQETVLRASGMPLE